MGHTTPLYFKLNIFKFTDLVKFIFPPFTTQVKEMVNSMYLYNTLLPSSKAKALYSHSHIYTHIQSAAEYNP